MAFCTNCGESVSDEASLCPECGHPQVPRRPPGGQNDGGAVASLVLGILGIFACPFVASIIALVLGIRAKGRIDRDPSKGGEGLAIGGIVTGGMGLLTGFVLVAIAVPTFFGARERAQDRAAQSSARNAMTAAKTIYTEAESYELATPDVLAQFEPSLNFVDSVPSTGPKVVSVSVRGPQEFRAAVLSDSGSCFAIRDHVGPEAVGTTFASVESACTPMAIPDVAYGASWD